MAKALLWLILLLSYSAAEQYTWLSSSCLLIETLSSFVIETVMSNLRFCQRDNCLDKNKNSNCLQLLKTFFTALKFSEDLDCH